MTCPGCGARNTEEAPWCTQCLRPLTSERAAPDPPAADERVTTSVADQDRPFRTVDGEVEWRCPTCANWNLLAIPSCAVCGQALAASGGRGDRLADRMARARRPLWVVAVIGAVVMIGSIVLLTLALRGGVGA